MTELSATAGFIVRIYRFDTEDKAKPAGLPETMDGSGNGHRSPTAASRPRY